MYITTNYGQQELFNSNRQKTSMICYNLNHIKLFDRILHRSLIHNGYTSVITTFIITGIASNKSING